MILPIPLCAVLSYPFSNSPTVYAGLIGWKNTVDIPTKFVEVGARINDQTGRWGAAISEEGLDPWRFDAGGAFGPDTVVNGPYPKGHALRERPGSGGGLVVCSAAWYDGQYYWAAIGYVSYAFDYHYPSFPPRPGDKEYYILDDGRKRYGYGVYVSEVLRATPDQLQHAMADYHSGQSTLDEHWSIGLKTSSTADAGWLSKQVTSTVSYEDMYDPQAVYSAFAAGARLLCTPDNVQTVATKRFTLLPVLEGVDPYRWTRAIPTLLYTFEFNDPLLANASVGSTTHYAPIDKGSTVYDRLNHRKVDGQLSALVPYGPPYGTYMFEWLVQHAWYDATQSIPQANQNSLQNVLAAIQLLSSIWNGSVAEIPDRLYNDWVRWTSSGKNYAKGWSNAWLRYRYEKSTTEMDVNEYVKFGLNVIDRYMMQITKSRAHGHASYQTETGTYECNCSMSWEEKGLTGLSKFFHGLWESGMEPNAYVLWDFVPFSFIADWFVPAGDFFEAHSSMQYRNAEYYSFSDIVFSIRYRTGPIDGMYADHYVRWVADSPPVPDDTYWFDDGGATTSGTTTFKRVLDSGSLIVGMSK
jgi:hypothetical protein